MRKNFYKQTDGMGLLFWSILMIHGVITL